MYRVYIMAFTRFNYDECRTKKILQESTGPGRYMLNKPGPGDNSCMMNDPQIRLQGWGANLRHVPGSSAIDISSDLLGITRPLSFCARNSYPNHGVVHSNKVEYPTCKAAITDQSRATHPAWLTSEKTLFDLEFQPLILNPQENVCMSFHNNLNTRNLERDNFVPKIPCVRDDM